jgi:single-strand DNA-binding protein
MGNRFDAYLAGRLATEPTLSTTKDGKPWVKFRLAVDDRSPNRETGEWETSQTIFHDVVAFGSLAERTVGILHSGDAVIAQGEFRFRSYEDSAGTTRTGTQFVASRLGPDILLSDVTLHGGRDREAHVERAQEVARESTASAGAQVERAEVPSPATSPNVAAGNTTAAMAQSRSPILTRQGAQAPGRMTDPPSPGM